MSSVVKELYEPLWEDMVQHLKSMGISVRAIWAADFASQGASYILNEDKIGDERKANLPVPLYGRRKTCKITNFI